ncbi:hypothetical protein ACOME3_006826 [Neoechinorhynchus agilis]
MSSRIFVGNLPLGTRPDDLEALFSRYGQLMRCDLREGIRGGYAFIDYSGRREAEEAVYGLEGYDFGGLRLKVEFYDADNRKRRPGMINDEGGRRFGGPRRFDPYETADGGRYGATRAEKRICRGEFRVIVTNVPYSASWQDLKDHMREAGDIVFADVNRDGTGSVEYSNYESMQAALKRLDESKMRSRQGDVSYIRVKPNRSLMPRRFLGSGDGFRNRRSDNSMNMERRDRRLMSRSPARPYTSGRRYGMDAQTPRRMGGDYGFT